MSENRRVIAKVSIENLRGITSGEVPLAPLTLLTGPNGCGKSTVLDALLIGGMLNYGEAVGQTVKRRAASLDGANWLISAGAEAGTIELQLGKETLQRRLTRGGVPGSEEIRALGGEGWTPFRSIVCSLPLAGRSTTTFRRDNLFEVRPGANSGPSPPGARLIDPSRAEDLAITFSRAYKAGREDEIVGFLRELVPGLTSMGPLVEENGSAQLYLHRAGGSRPVSVAGDGIQALAQMAVELAVLENGTLGLVEEPEVFSHLRSLRQVAQVLTTSARRGVQIVATTHSLELIDAVMVALGSQIEDFMGVANLALVDGQLRCSYFKGNEILAARESLGQDLR